MELKNYETIFILTPVLSQQQIQEGIDKYKDFLQKESAEIVHKEKIGLKKMAYAIQKKSTGFYYLIEFKAAPTVIEKLATEYRRDERVLRFMTVTLDKHGVAYNQHKRSSRPADHTKDNTEAA